MIFVLEFIVYVAVTLCSVTLVVPVKFLPWRVTVVPTRPP